MKMLEALPHTNIKLFKQITHISIYIGYIEMKGKKTIMIESNS